MKVTAREYQAYGDGKQKDTNISQPPLIRQKNKPELIFLFLVI